MGIFVGIFVGREGKVAGLSLEFTAFLFALTYCVLIVSQSRRAIRWRR